MLPMIYIVVYELFPKSLCEAQSFIQQKTNENSETSERLVETRHQAVYFFKSHQFGTVHQTARVWE